MKSLLVGLLATLMLASGLAQGQMSLDAQLVVTARDLLVSIDRVCKVDAECRAMVNERLKSAISPVDAVLLDARIVRRELELCRRDNECRDEIKHLRMIGHTAEILGK